MSMRLSTGEVSVPSPAPWLHCVTEAGGHGSVLVAAHDPDLRRQVCRPLLEHGLEVVEAADAEEAVRLARKVPVEVAIVEVDRPGLDGAEVFRRWQEIGPGRYVPLVLLTRRSAPDDVAASIHLGAHDYVLAPVDAFDVLARVHSALAAKHRHDSFRREVSELQQLVLTDPLTGLYNRRHMEAELAALVSAARRRGTPLGILLVDVDRFKRINDRLGHHAGDIALRTVAHRIRSIVRAEDVVGRWGGDEFVVLLPSTDQAAAVTLARRLCGAVAQPGAGDSLEVRITVSVGCAAGVGEASALISAADAALPPGEGRRAQPRRRLAPRHASRSRLQATLSTASEARQWLPGRWSDEPEPREVGMSVVEPTLCPVPRLAPPAAPAQSHRSRLRLALVTVDAAATTVPWARGSALRGETVLVEGCS